MNRYTAAGLIRDAVGGKTAIVLSPGIGMASDALNCLVTVLSEIDPDAYRVRRTNGDPRIEFTGAGRIFFGSVRSSLRGMTPDVVFIDQDADRILSDTERARLHCDLVGALALGGEVIHS